MPLSKKKIRREKQILLEINRRKCVEYKKNELLFRHYPKYSGNYGKKNAIWVSINYANALEILDMLSKHSKIECKEVFECIDKELDVSKKKTMQTLRASLVVQCNSDYPMVQIVLIYNRHANLTVSSFQYYPYRKMYTFDIGERKCIYKDVIVCNYGDLVNTSKVVSETEWVPDDYIIKKVQEDIIMSDMRIFVLYKNIIKSFWIKGYERRKKRIRFVNSCDFIIYLPWEIVEACMSYFGEEEGIFISFVNVNKLGC
jgi:hypothetical protein